MGSRYAAAGSLRVISCGVEIGSLGGHRLYRSPPIRSACDRISGVRSTSVMKRLPKPSSVLAERRLSTVDLPVVEGRGFDRRDTPVTDGGGLLMTAEGEPWT